MVKKFIVILSVVLGSMTSCQKEEPIEPPTYNQIDQPPTNDIPKFVGSTWVIYKFQTLNLVTQPEIVSDTLRFVNNTELTYNNISCEYVFYPSGYLWYFELKQMPFLTRVLSKARNLIRHSEFCFAHFEDCT